MVAVFMMSSNRKSQIRVFSVWAFFPNARWFWTSPMFRPNRLLSNGSCFLCRQTKTYKFEFFWFRLPRGIPFRTDWTSKLGRQRIYEIGKLGAPRPEKVIVLLSKFHEFAFWAIIFSWENCNYWNRPAVFSWENGKSVSIIFCFVVLTKKRWNKL